MLLFLLKMGVFLLKVDYVLNWVRGNGAGGGGVCIENNV